MTSPSFGNQPHRRFNPLNGEWVLVSGGRTRRPWLGAAEDGHVASSPTYDPDCYLCPGNLRANGARNPDYSGTYVFTNDFAALDPDAPVLDWQRGLLQAETEPGTCRVLCFSPRHDLTLGGLSHEEVCAVVDVWSAESAELGRRFPWIQVFENRGAAMGASNPHPHGQIWAAAHLPRDAARELEHQAAYHRDHARPLLLDYAVAEETGPRVVEIDSEWLAVVPFWAVWPYELLIFPRRPATRLPDLDDPARDSLARTLHRLLARYDTLFDVPFPYSMGWHQAPFDGRPHPEWQLHAHVFPPLLDAGHRKFMVGYELLSEAQRDITAEDAARRLREAVRAEVPAEQRA